MINLQTKEHLVYFMQCGMMKLSNYDLNFVQSLNHLILTNNPITSNQVKLLDKLIEKYKRQFTKHKLNLKFIQSLPWRHKIIESIPEYTQAFISIEDNQIILRAPFNKKFIKDFRDYDVNPFKWNRVLKRYEGDYSTYALKILYSSVIKNYNVINYCPIATDLLNTLKDYDSSVIWEPTLVSSNGRFYIVATNEILYNAISHISLTDDIKTINKLTEYGIKISDAISTDEKIKFAGSFFYETDHKNLEQVADWLKEIGCDSIFFSGLSQSTIRKDLFKKLDTLQIDYYNQSDVLFTTNKMVKDTYNFIAYIQFSSVSTSHHMTLINRHKVRKIIKVNNSQPIILK